MEPGFFQITLKVLLYNSQGQLLILKDQESQAGDLPGGRLSVSELYAPWQQAIAREIKEELGGEAQWSVDAQPFAFRPHRVLNGNHPALCFFYKGRYISGSIALSAEHDAMSWVEPPRFNQSGWFRGTMQEALDSLLKERVGPMKLPPDLIQPLAEEDWHQTGQP
jgi:hypothetical protein